MLCCTSERKFDEIHLKVLTKSPPKYDLYSKLDKNLNRTMQILKKHIYNSTRCKADQDGN
jgi:hypothetical protein